MGREDLEHVVAALDDARRYADGELVDYFRRRVASCAADDGARGPKATLPAVLGVLAAVEQMAHEVRPSLRRGLLTVGGHAAEFAGWLYRDIGTRDLASYWRDRAMEWAQVADDTAMQGYVLLKKSQGAWDDRDAVRMLALTQAVREGPWQLPPRVRSEAAQQEARGHAMLRDDLGRMERRLDEAQRLLTLDSPEHTVGGQAAHLGAHYDARLLATQTAICYREAGQPGRALHLYQQWLSGGTFSRRDYGYFLSLMGQALASVREPDEAARVGLEAHAVAVATTSARTLHELARLSEGLRPWAGRAAVQELREAVLA